MFHAIVLLLTLFTCINGEINSPKALIPLARSDAQQSASSLIHKIMNDPKVFVSELASADPQVVRNVIALLEGLVATATTQIGTFQKDVSDALTDKNTKTIKHDDLDDEVTTLTSSLAAKTIDLATAVTEKKAAETHYTAMVSVRDANVGTLETENKAIGDAVSLLRGLFPTTNCDGAPNGGWSKVYQILNGRDKASTSFPLTIAAVGDINAAVGSANAKLSDDKINVLAAPYNGYTHLYKLQSSEVTANLYIRTNSSYVDTLPSFGVGTEAKLGLGTSYATVTDWLSIYYDPAHGIDLFHAQPQLRRIDDCDRFMFGHGSLDCYQGPSDKRCVSGGGLCGTYRKLQDLVLYVYSNKFCAGS